MQSGVAHHMMEKRININVLEEVDKLRKQLQLLQKQHEAERENASSNVEKQNNLKLNYVN